MKYFAAILLTITTLYVTVAAISPALAGSRTLTEAEIEALVAQYTPDGYDPTYLKKMFGDPRVRYVPNLVRIIIIPPDFTANYTRFTEKAALERAREFSRTWKSDLKKAERASGVDSGVIAAILLVETELGKNVGRSPVMSVFASLLLDSSLHRTTFAESLKGNARKDHYLNRLDSRAAWAREELRALITMHVRRSIDVGGLRGSYAGAFGIAQFLPTSYLKWAHSGEDGRHPDLFYMPHAIMSVANYLQQHGWRPDLEDEKKHSVIWTYNRSRVYVDTVLAIAKQLKQDSA